MFQSPILYILAPIILACITNFIIFRYKWNKQKINPYLPPGYIIGIVWIIIFGFLGYTFYLLLNKNKKFTIGLLALILMLIFCLLYPFFTQGFNNEYISRFLNILTFIFSIIVGLIVFSEYKSAFLYIIPLILWSLYVNVSDLL